jgi:hypothetical protein
MARKLNPMREEDKMCLCKIRFPTIDAARVKAQNIRRSGGTPFKLYAYRCPYCDNYHLTKHSRPLNPELKDRVNIEL